MGGSDMKRFLSDFDLHLFGEGTHLEVYERLGSHLVAVDGKKGANFAVWAPNADEVSVVGDFNGWDRSRHRMNHLGHSGIWDLFIPAVEQGANYKYSIKSKTGETFEKADPYGFHFEVPPKSATKVWDLGGYAWGDGEWMAKRAASNPLDGPVNVYECHIASWRRVPEEGCRNLTYRELAHVMPEYLKSMGYTHVELIPIMEHPFGGSWGYQTLGYFAPTSRHGTPQDFMYFVDRCHQAGLGVILDWVPSHFATDGHGLGRFDGTGLYEHADPRKGFHPDWGSYIFNYGRHEVKNFLLSSALFWLKQYHADGLRVDAVASMLYLDYSRKNGEWIPNRYGGRENLEAVEFLKTFNTIAHRDFPGVLTVAEESTAWPQVSRPVHLGGLGFSLKWNMGWMHDMLTYIAKEPVHRRYHHNDATFAMIYAYHENFMLVLSHDEVVHGKRALLDKMPGDLWQKFANMRVFYGFMMAFPGKKLLFMGGEFGQWWEWDHNQSLQWHLLDYQPHRQLQDYVKSLNQLYLSEPSLHQKDFEPGGFEWIDCNDSDNSVFTMIRYDRERRNFLVIACNFTPVPRHGYRMGMPLPGSYREVLNSDSEFFGGSNVGNGGGVQTEDTPWHGRPCSAVVTLPPLAAVVLKPSWQ
ncbi:MAG: 1,4-alpha-glucan branching protein GlgB [Elusimicrobia bacterium]|nr:1,4-alpha-glucan branching protein GlgB [Elusimicrobiota bacterium]